jgi:hypothetical protein
MRRNTIAIALLCVAVGCAGHNSPSTQCAKAQHPSSAGIEERILAPASRGDTAQLYLVLTAKGDVRTWGGIVVRNAREALDSLDEFGDGGANFIVVFFIKPTRGSDTGAVSGFSRTQLKELTELPEEKARMKVSEHAWTFEKKPKKIQNN